VNIVRSVIPLLIVVADCPTICVPCLRQQQQQQQQVPGTAAAEEAELLQRVLQRAGELSSTAAAAEALQPLELFYARPSLSAPALLR
jgi:hypothetical protein